MRKITRHIQNKIKEERSILPCVSQKSKYNVAMETCLKLGMNYRERDISHPHMTEDKDVETEGQRP